MSATQLAPEEREFFGRVAETMYTNPFTVSREMIERRFADVLTTSSEGEGHHFGSIAPPLESRLAALERRGITRLHDLHGEERELVRHAYLFAAYHACVERLDEHIEAQLEVAGDPIPVPFADEVLEWLAGRGFSPSEAVRYFGLFFQLRRAYYFIDRALVGASPSMAELRRALWTCVFTEDARVYDTYLWSRMEDFSTLLLGETGTGKGAAAAAIGRSGFIPFDVRRKCFSESFTETFTATNLSQFPESLLESELFGHRKGAFTGAVDNHKGLFESCSPHGSLFLDEIGEVSVETQIKLLKVIQERIFTPVGSHQERRFSGRVIAATNRTLSELRENGFRDDFFYRLSSLVITVPPLRQRIAESAEELPRLVELLVARMVGESRPELTERVLGVIRRDIPADYGWPGNVRELEQVIRRVLLSQSGKSLAPDVAAGTLTELLERGELTAQELLARYCALLYSTLGSYEEVGRRTGLDRRTVKKHVQAADSAA